MLSGPPLADFPGQGGHPAQGPVPAAAWGKERRATDRSKPTG